MNIEIISDLHIEFHSEVYYFPRVVKKDTVLTIAGDLVPATHRSYKSILKSACISYTDVVYVAGNHEYYGNPFFVGNKLIKQAVKELTNLHYLDKSVVEIDGVTFAGSTHWFPYTTDCDKHKYLLSDFRQISDLQEIVYLENQLSREFFIGVEADVWVTHHLPSSKSIHSKYKNSQTNCYFVDEFLEELIYLKQPKLVIHGHTHESCDYYLGKTNIVCNPYGYEPKEVNQNYVPNLTKEI